jgi:hypothetical protein
VSVCLSLVYQIRAELGLVECVKVVPLSRVAMDKQPPPGAISRATGTAERHDEPPDEVVDVLAKSLQLGAGAGTNQTHITPSFSPVCDADLWVGACGMLFGATSGIIRGVKTPVLFSLVAGFQWFGISSVFYGISMSFPRPGRSTPRKHH